MHSTEHTVTDHRRALIRKGAETLRSVLTIGSWGVPTDGETSAREDGQPDVRRRWVVLVLGFALVVRLLATLDAVRPIVFEDEIGYLANARLMAGLGAADLGQMGSYQAGWSLVLVPIYWVSQDPDVIYRIAVTIAMLAGWAAAFPVAGLLRRVTGLKHRQSILVAALGCLTPGSVLMGGYVYAEGILTLGLAVVLLLAFMLWERPSVARAIGLAAGGGYLYGVHGRMIAVPVLVIVYLVGAVVVGKMRAVVALAGVAAVVSVVLLSRGLDAYMISRMYDLPFDRLSTGLSGIGQLTPRGLVVLAGGQVWYLMAATAGLALVGIVAIVGNAFREVVARRFGPWTFWAMVAASVYAVSFLNFARTFPNPIRLDYLSYGRYVDVLTPMLVSLTLGLAVKRPRPMRTALAAAAVFTGALGLAFFVAAGRGPAFVGKPIAALSVSGVAWAIQPGLDQHPVIPATIGAVVVGLCFAAFGRRPLALIVAWTMVASGAAIVGEFRTMRTLDAPWSELLTLQETLQDLSPDEISYDLTSCTFYGRNGYQYYLPESTFIFFDGRVHLPKTELVIGRRDWDLGEEAGARVVAAETGINEALWVMPGELQAQLEDDGRLADTAVAAPSLDLSPGGCG